MSAKSKTTLKVNSNQADLELLSYIINVNPELKEDIGLPEQGANPQEIGRIIVNNERYKNAVLNTINVLALTVIDRNTWDDPWYFTDRGTITFGQTVREIIVDLAKVFDYNENLNNTTRFLQTQVPNILQYLHELNFQKVYETATFDEEFALAMTSEGGLFRLIDKVVASLYESWKYDKYIISKYMLCRRILDGTVTPIYIPNYATATPRQRVSKIKNASNLMTFRSPNYNPAGVRKAASFSDQIMILSTDFEADLTTEVLATSYFRNDAELKTNLALIDGFGNHDTVRLTEVLGASFVPFTPAEILELSQIPAVIIEKEWFQVYLWAFDTQINVGKGTKFTDFYNPTTLGHNMYLHVWAVMSTSPFMNAGVVTTTEPAVTTIIVNPQNPTINPNVPLQLSAVVTTNGYANESVVWSTNATSDVAKITQQGVFTALKTDFDDTGEYTVQVTATSVYDNTKTATTTIKIVQ